MSELTKRSFLNLTTSLFKSGGLMLLTFIFTPLVLKYIGATNFGTFKTLMEVYGTLSLLEMGQFASLVACLIPLFKKGDTAELKELLSEANRRFLIVMFLNITIGVLLFPFLKRLTSWPYQDTNELYITWTLIVSTALFIPSITFKAFLEAGNNGHKLNLIFMFQNICFLVLGFIFAWMGFGLIAQALGAVISGAIGVVLLKLYSGLNVPLTFEKSDKFHRKISQNQKPQILNEIASKISLNCDQLIIAFFIGPLMVTKVFLGQRVVQIIQVQLQAIGQTSWASLGSLYYDNESDRSLFKKRTIEMNKFLSALSVSVLIPACLLNTVFLKLWIGNEYLMDGNTLVYLASGNAFFWALFSFWGLLFSVLGKPQELTKMIWAQALINVFASISLTYVMGGVGPIAGTLVSNLLIPMWCYPKLLKKHFSLPYKTTISTIMFPGFVGIASIALYDLLPWKFSSMNWVEFLLSGTVIFCTYVLFFYLLYFNAEERVLYKKRVSKLWEGFRRR